MTSTSLIESSTQSDDLEEQRLLAHFRACPDRHKKNLLSMMESLARGNFVSVYFQLVDNNRIYKG